MGHHPTAKAKSIPPPGPRAVWGGHAGPGASASGSAQAAGNDRNLWGIQKGKPPMMV